jgi:hypothetical protein
MMVERKVKYFERTGKQNTKATIEAVRSYLQKGNKATALIVASISGQTALNAQKALKGISIPIVCVTGSPSWQNYPEYKFPLIPKNTRTQLDKSGVIIVDSAPSSLTDTVEFGFARYGSRSPAWMFIETLLSVGGYGLKTAVECILMATDGGYVAPFKEVLSIGGTGKGADTAIVAHSSFSSTAFSSNPKKRFVINEILAMPRNKTFYKRITMGDWSIEETK